MSRVWSDSIVGVAGGAGAGQPRRSGPHRTLPPDTAREEGGAGHTHSLIILDFQNYLAFLSSPKVDHITFSKVLPHYLFRLNRPERDSLKL